MHLTLIYVPSKDAAVSARFYRETLGWQEAWREGETTIALTIPGSDIQLMLDEDETEPRQTGPMFKVEDVIDFYRRNQGNLEFLSAPKDIPPGKYVAFRDVDGYAIRLYDETHQS